MIDSYMSTAFRCRLAPCRDLPSSLIGLKQATNYGLMQTDHDGHFSFSASVLVSSQYSESCGIPPSVFLHLILDLEEEPARYLPHCHIRLTLLSCLPSCPCTLINRAHVLIHLLQKILASRASHVLLVLSANCHLSRSFYTFFVKNMAGIPGFYGGVPRTASRG